MGFSGFTDAFGAAGKSGGSWVVTLYDVKGVTLVVLEYSYEGVVTKGGGGDEALVGRVCNRADEVAYSLVDLFGREVRGWGTGEGVELVELESALFLVAPPGKELTGARNLEGALGTR